jgi:hypothetical protein
MGRKLKIPEDIVREIKSDPGLPEQVVVADAQLRSDLRGAQKALRMAHDFLSDGTTTTLRAERRRDELLRVIELEISGI